MNLCRLPQAVSMEKLVVEQELFKPLCCICDGVRMSRKTLNALLIILKLIQLHAGGSILKSALLSASFFFIYATTGYSCRSFSKKVAAGKALMVSV